MSFTGRYRGVIGGLIRERRPFAVLAVLAALLPYVLSGAGLHGANGIRLADGTLVICTSEGFKRIADDRTGTGHDLNDCCKSGCIHAFSKVAIGPAPAAGPVRIALADGIAWARLSLDTRHDARTATPGIRAPPAVSA